MHTNQSPCNASPRRAFLRLAGGGSLGMLVPAAPLTGTPADRSPPPPPAPQTSAPPLFNGNPSTTEDRIARVKCATLGMQRYDWEQGTVAQAFLEMGEHDLVISFARAAILRQVKGRFSVLKGNGPITDCASVGEAVLAAGRLTGNPLFEAGARAMLEVIDTTQHRAADGTIYHTQEPAKWIMSDAFYMLPPFLAAAGRHGEALHQIEGLRKHLYHPSDQLYSHIWNDSEGRFKRREYWGVGNGWTAAGLTRVLRHLPATLIQERRRLIGYVREVLDGCLAHLLPDGLFHDVVNDRSTFREVNLSQMLAYTIYRGVAAGYLEDTYLDKADRMRRAANARVDALGYVNEVCGLPNFDRLYFAPEAQAFYLLMETAARDLAALKRT